MSESKALAVIPLTDIREMANVVAKSGLFPDVKTTESAMALMLLCQAEGIHPMQALRRYHLIQGRPAMKADAMLAEFQTRGGKVEWKTNDEKTCEAVFTAPGVMTPTTVRWTMQDATTAGVTGNPTWKKYPRQMLRARVISEAIRMCMPEVVVGIYTPEEVADFTPAKVEYLPPTAGTSVATPALAVVASPSTNGRDSAASSAPTIISADTHPAVEAVKSAFPGAKEADRTERLRMIFTLPAPEGLGWKGKEIVAFIGKHFVGVKKLAELTPDQVVECERMVIALLPKEAA